MLLLKKINEFITVEDLGRNRFKVHYDSEIAIIDENLKYLSNHTIQKYLTPLVILRILKDYNDGDVVTTLFKYAVSVNLINNNYPYVKKYKTSTSSTYNIDKSTIGNYYSITDAIVKYNLTNSIEKLSNLGIIKYDRPFFVVYREYQDYHVANNLNVRYKEFHKLATDEEVRFVTDVEYKLRELEEYKDLTDRDLYYRSNFKSELSKSLKSKEFITSEGKKIIIIDVYKGYRIFYTTIEKCLEFLNNFEGYKDEISLISSLNEEVSKLILNKLNSPTEKQILDFKKLISYTILNNCEKMELDESPIIDTHVNNNNEIVIDVYNEYNINS